MFNVNRRQGVALLIVLALFVIAFALYRDTVRSMVTVWFGSNTYLHGALIMPLAAYLVCRDRRLWMPLEFRTSWSGITILAFSIFVWLLGELVSVQVVSQLAFISMLIAIVWSVLGTDVTRALHFPLLFMYFAVPFGEFLVPKLMEWTADVTVWAMQLSGFPVHREGNYFSLPSGNFRVIEACSGIRFLIVTAVLALYFSYETFRGWKKRLAFVIVAMLAMIATNWIRAYLVVLVAHLTNMRFGSGQSHIYMGWIIFLVVICSLFWVGRKYQDPLTEEPAGYGGKANKGGLSSQHEMLPRDIGLPLITLFILLAGPYILASKADLEVDRPLEFALPLAVADWAGPRPLTIGFEPGYLGATKEIAGQYYRGDEYVEVFAYLYLSEEQGSELIGWQSRLLRDDRWAGGRDRTLTVQVSPSRRIKVEEALITDGTQRLRVWYWFDIGGKQLVDPRMAKVYQAWNALSGRRLGDAAVVIVVPDFETGDETASDTLHAFAEEHVEVIENCMRNNNLGKSEVCAQFGP